MKTRWFALVAVGLAVLGACSRDPGDPAYDNPFDPDGTNPGTGYGLLVEVRGDSVVMTWDDLEGVLGYHVYWSDVSSGLSDTVRITTSTSLVPPNDSAPRVQYSHRKFTAERTNWYRVAGLRRFDGGTREETMEPSAPVPVDISVLVLPTGAITATPTRLIGLDVLTGAAGAVEIANDRDFADARTYPVNPGEATQVEFELPGVEADRTDLWVHFRALDQGSASPADSFAIQARFDPRLETVSGLRLDPSTRRRVMVADTMVFSFAPVDGQLLDRVYRQRVTEDTAGSSTPEYEDVEEIVASLDAPFDVIWDPQVEPPRSGRLKAILTSDFGFADSVTVELAYPDSIGTPSIEVVGGQVTTSEVIEVRCVAASAGYVHLSTSPDFSTGAPVPFADTVDYTLEVGPGSHLLYALFTNPILPGETAVAVAPVILVSPPAPRGR
jgi:hypothetical protein